jgi:hypothetical protein
MENSEILKMNIGKPLRFEDLRKTGFKDDKIIKSNSLPSNPMLGEVKFHKTTNYEGVTLNWDGHMWFHVEANDYSLETADKLNEIRNLEYEIEKLENEKRGYLYGYYDLDSETEKRYADICDEGVEECLEKINKIKASIA